MSIEGQTRKQIVDRGGNDRSINVGSASEREETTKGEGVQKITVGIGVIVTLEGVVPFFERGTQKTSRRYRRGGAGTGRHVARTRVKEELKRSQAKNEGATFPKSTGSVPINTRSIPRVQEEFP